jgi:hypothetical protein
VTTWRVGRKLGRTLYRDEVCVGIVDTPEIAAEIVAACNGKEAARCVGCMRRPDGALIWRHADCPLHGTRASRDDT